MSHRKAQLMKLMLSNPHPIKARNYILLVARAVVGEGVSDFELVCKHICSNNVKTVTKVKSKTHDQKTKGISRLNRSFHTSCSHFSQLVLICIE